MLKKAWLCGASCAALMTAHAAYAQQKGLETIIVTAQKVRANVQKVPQAVQTVAGRAVLAAGVDNAKDLNRLVSSLSVQVAAGGASSFYIRGVGDDNGNATTDSGVAVSLDQVFFSRAYGPDLVFYDLDRIEVLKGPQGTLYGRNATGGAINIVTTKPTMGAFNGYARLELGDYGEIRSNAAVNLPLSPTLEARIALQTDEHSGYLTDGYDDNKNRAGRIHLLWKPTADFSLLVSGEYDHSGGKGQEPVDYLNNQFQFSNPYLGGVSPQVNAYIFGLAAAAGPPGPMGPGNANLGTPAHYFTAPGSCYPGCLPRGFTDASASPVGQPYVFTNNGYLDTTVQSIRADLEWNLGFGTLSVIPAALNTYYDTLFHNGPPPFFNDGSSRQQSLEARIASPQDQRLTWLAGIFGLQEKQGFQQIVALGAPFAYQGQFEPDLLDKAGGVFTQGTFKILPTLSLVAGARYSVENKVNTNAIADNSAIAPIPGLVEYAVAPINKEHSEAPTFRIGLDWQVLPDNLLYASYATGFHSGGLQQGQPPVRPLCVPDLSSPTALAASLNQPCDAPGDYKPEKLKAYTIGSKNRFFDNRFQINVEGYYWDYTNLQVGTLGLVNPGQTGQVVQNAGKATIKGFDVDARAQLTSNDTVGLSLNYNHSRYGTLEFFNYIVGSPFPPSISNLSGQTFVNAPDLTFTASYDHVFSFPSGATLTPNISAQYSSLITYSVSPAQTQPAFYKIDLSLTYRSPSDKYEIGLFVRNVNNAVTLTGGAGIDSTANQPYVFLAPPRTFGGNLQVNF